MKTDSIAGRPADDARAKARLPSGMAAPIRHDRYGIVRESVRAA